MMVSDKAWIEKARIRKAVRDEVRQRIFSQCGVTCSDGNELFSGASRDQLPLIGQLLAMTDQQSPGNGALSQLRAQLGAVGLAVGPAAERVASTLSMQDVSMKTLRETWFSSPAFFD